MTAVFLAVAVVVSVLLSATPAHAAALGCGTTITTNTVLQADVGPCTGDGLIVQGDGIKLVLGGHTVRGAGAQTGNTVGVRIVGSHDVRVVGGTVSGFDAGLVIMGGGNDTIVGTSAVDNIGNGSNFCDGVAVIGSPDDQLVGLHVQHNGPCDGIGVFGTASTGDLISGSLIEDQTVPRFPGAHLSTDFGIDLGQGYDTWPSHVTIKGNVIRNNDGGGILACSEFGIPCVTTDDDIEGNLVQHNGFYLSNVSHLTPGFGGDGIRLVANLAIGISRAVTRITVKGNTVVDNADNGILVATEGNTIVGNKTNGNNQSRDFFAMDLKDTSFGQGPNIPPCDSNTWSGNTWGFYYQENPSIGPVGFTKFGAYDPECVSAGGSGPRPGARASFPPA